MNAPVQIRDINANSEAFLSERHCVLIRHSPATAPAKSQWQQQVHICTNHFEVFVAYSEFGVNCTLNTPLLESDRLRARTQKYAQAVVLLSRRATQLEGGDK